ncbi:MgtC/SapB family protein [Opitutaceae bacterium]
MLTLIASVAASAGLGALIGFIRQWGEQSDRAGDTVTGFAGVRTHTLWAVLGCLAAFASLNYVPLAWPVVILAITSHLILLRWTGESGTSPGGTTFAAGLLTVFIGSLVAWDHTQAAVVVAAITMVLLGFKHPIHALTRRFTEADIRATLQFVAVSGVILPLVPDRAFGPYAGFNPYTIWMMVVLISGLGFMGYIAMRLLGARAGIFVTSLLGGMASSTASTLAFSRRSQEEPAYASEYAFAVVCACTVMMPRVLIAISVLNLSLTRTLILPFVLMMLPAVGYGLWLWRRRRASADKLPSPKISNPLSLLTAIKFALLYAVISFLVKSAAELELHSGLLPLSFISGLTDMDAISLSMAGSAAAEQVTLTLAAKSVLIAAVANSLLKIGLAVSLGAPKLRSHVAIVLGLTALTGLGGLLLV